MPDNLPLRCSAGGDGFRSFYANPPFWLTTVDVIMLTSPQELPGLSCTKTRFRAPASTIDPRFECPGRSSGATPTLLARLTGGDSGLPEPGLSALSHGRPPDWKLSRIWG
jgi:hypothetical protein